MSSIISTASCAVGCCFGLVAVGVGIAGGICLGEAVKASNIYNQCCGETNQYNTHYPCPGGGLKDRAEFCDLKEDSKDSFIKFGSIFLASTVALCCLATLCGVLSSSLKRRGYRQL